MRYREGGDLDTSSIQDRRGRGGAAGSAAGAGASRSAAVASGWSVSSSSC